MFFNLIYFIFRLNDLINQLIYLLIWFKSIGYFIYIWLIFFYLLNIVFYISIFLLNIFIFKFG